MKKISVAGISLVALAVVAGAFFYSKRDAPLERALRNLNGAEILDKRKIIGKPSFFDQFTIMNWTFATSNKDSYYLYEKCNSSKLSNYEANKGNGRRCLVSMYYDCDNRTAYNLTITGNTARISAISMTKEEAAIDFGGAVCSR